MITAWQHPGPSGYKGFCTSKGPTCSRRVRRVVSLSRVKPSASDASRWSAALPEDAPAPGLENSVGICFMSEPGTRRSISFLLLMLFQLCLPAGDASLLK